MQTGYNAIVKNCELFDYKYEQGKVSNNWVEYWIDDTHKYKAIFPENSNSFFPSTYITTKL